MKYKVLIIDDDVNILETIKRRLDFEEKLQVIAKTNPLEAIDMIKREKVDIILTDISMPEMNGLDVLKNVKDIDAFAQVIIMTGYSTSDLAIECLRYGANDYLLKPFDDMEAIVNLINITIEKIIRWKKIIIRSVKTLKV
ncbi:MAG TPA: response regulator [bacterium]|nr:response regulator [bacterium]HPP86593.1 response regulator [bacterium]